MSTGRAGRIWRGGVRVVRWFIACLFLGTLVCSATFWVRSYYVAEIVGVPTFVRSTTSGAEAIFTSVASINGWLWIKRSATLRSLYESSQNRRIYYYWTGPDPGIVPSLPWYGSIEIRTESTRDPPRVRYAEAEAYIPHWWLVVGSGLGFIATTYRPVARWWRVRRRRAAGLCMVCGYDLRGTPERCPECGTVSDSKAERRTLSADGIPKSE